MLVRGGSPVNGAVSGLAGPKAEKISFHQFLLPPPSCDGLSGRAASSPLGPLAPLLPAADALPGRLP